MKSLLTLRVQNPYGYAHGIGERKSRIPRIPRNRKWQMDEQDGACILAVRVHSVILLSRSISSDQFRERRWKNDFNYIQDVTTHVLFDRLDIVTQPRRRQRCLRSPRALSRRSPPVASNLGFRVLESGRNERVPRRPREFAGDHPK